MTSVRILVADDHEVFRRGLRSLLESRSDWEICGEASNGADAVDKAKELKPDVVVMDITMPRLNGLQAAHLIRTQVPDSAIIILSQYEASLMAQSALDAGANAYVAKSQVSRDLLSAVETVTRKTATPAPQLPAIAPILTNAETSSRSSCLAGGGEMGALMRSKDWSKTALGDPESWPTALRLAVRIMLGSGYPMAIAWGSRFTLLYNDAYRPILARTKHPGALGRGIPEIFPEIWDFVGPMFERVLREGEQTTLVDQLLVLDRKGFIEECYFTFSYSPITEDDGHVGGALVTVIETTERVLADRRTRTLNEIGEHLAVARSEADIAHTVADILGRNSDDFPFAFLYLGREGEDLSKIELVASTNGSPLISDLRGGNPWPFEEILSSGSLAVTSADRALAGISRTPLGDPVLTIATIPLKSSRREAPAGFLVCGLNPRRELDAAYQAFLARVATDIATALTAVRAFDAERRRAEALAELDSAKTSFFSNVSHEFRTPLTLMLSPLEEILTREGKVIELEREHVEMVYRNGLRMLKLVNTLLDFSRIEAGRVQAHYEPTDISILTRDLAGVFESAIARAGVKLHVDCPPLPEPVFVDRDMWEKIVLNLLSNALKFTASGEIRVQLMPVEGDIELVVSDTGIGIPEAELPRVFERFHRIANPLARTHEGSGIGLALVQELVKLHGGSIRAESTEGEGSKFKVRLPFGAAHLPQDRVRSKRNLEATALSATPFVEEALRWLPAPSLNELRKEEFSAASHQPEAEGSSPGRLTARILVVDDNADMRDYLRRLLEERYEVDVAENGETALMAARQRPPDLIISDIMMPRMTGIELLREIRKDPDLNTTHIILVSARPEPESQLQALDAGADYLVKPFTARELLARVSSHLALRQLQSEWAERERRLRNRAELGRKRLEELFEQAPAAIAVLSGPEHRWTFANPEYLKMAGVKHAEQLLGKTVRETLPDLEKQPFFDLLDQVYRFGVPFHGKEMKALWKRAKPGRPAECYYSFVYQPMRNEQGQVEGILVHAIDVTEQVLARHAVEQAQEQFRNFFRMAPVGAALVEFDTGNILEVNDTFLDLTGYSREELIGKTTLGITHPDDRDEHVRSLSAYQANPVGTFRLEKRYLRKNGNIVWVQTAANPVRDANGRPIYSVAVAADITERKSAEAELRATQETLEMRIQQRTTEAARAEKGLRTLSARLLQVQDEERRRIARDLHDSAGQMLVSLDLDLCTLLRETSRLTPGAAEALERGLATVQEMSKELRTIAHLLHPPLLDETGLPSAIRWYVEGFADRSKIAVDLKLDSDLGRLSRDQELVIFRIVQESLTNIHRHSGSTTATVTVGKTEEGIHVTIRDRGRGMAEVGLTAANGSPRPGVGVQGMQERVRQLGGTLEFRAAKPGTMVVARLPVGADSADQESKAAEAG